MAVRQAVSDYERSEASRVEIGSYAARESVTLGPATGYSGDIRLNTLGVPDGPR